MHIGTSYKPGEFIIWTRRKLYPLIGMAFFPVILYQCLGWKWVDIPWAVVGLVVPFSIIISWIYVSLDLVGESTENPFEGGANDVPMTQIAQIIERDMREVLEEQGVPAPATAKNNIIM